MAHHRSIKFSSSSSSAVFRAATLAAGANLFAVPYISPTGEHAVSVRYGDSWGAKRGAEIEVRLLGASPTSIGLVCAIAIVDVDIYVSAVSILN